MSEVGTPVTEVEGRVMVVVYEREEDIDPVALAAYVNGEGPLPPNARLEEYESWTKRGRLPDCDCQLIQCVCAEARRHLKSCQYRFAMTCAVPIECDHGFDVCPTCDPCNCPGGDAK